jgi:hypothetical protein
MGPEKENLVMRCFENDFNSVDGFAIWITRTGMVQEHWKRLSDYLSGGRVKERNSVH